MIHCKNWREFCYIFITRSMDDILQLALKVFQVSRRKIKELKTWRCASKAMTLVLWHTGRTYPSVAPPTYGGTCMWPWCCHCPRTGNTLRNWRVYEHASRGFQSFLQVWRFARPEGCRRYRRFPNEAWEQVLSNGWKSDTGPFEGCQG